MTKVQSAVAHGVLEVVKTIVEETTPPDETPYGQGLVDHGGWGVLVDGGVIESGSLSGVQPTMPHGLDVPPDTVLGVAGFSFPGRFQEVGTSHQPARPFFWTTALRIKSRADSIIAAVVKAELR
jgi:hypothetical protein